MLQLLAALPKITILVAKQKLFCKKIYKEEQTLIEPKHVKNLAWNIVILRRDYLPKS
jgi:hypothetical protein